jgi:hypothetical protein
VRSLACRIEAGLCVEEESKKTTCRIGVVFLAFEGVLERFFGFYDFDV